MKATNRDRAGKAIHRASIAAVPLLLLTMAVGCSDTETAGPTEMTTVSGVDSTTTSEDPSSTPDETTSSTRLTPSTTSAETTPESTPETSTPDEVPTSSSTSEEPTVDVCEPSDEGQSCGDCGITVCVDDQLECDDPGLNACGECGDLPEEFGEPCDFGCEVGEWVCDADSPTGISCDAPEPNECGGCEPQPDDFELNADCGCGGEWLCVQGEPECFGGDSVNPCGGCGFLEGTPGQSCGVSGESPCAEWTCADDGDSVFCDTSIEPNACGGCASLPEAAEPQESCGCSGEWQCIDQGEAIVCQNDFTNQCGGCTSLGGTPGASCGDCGTFACDGTDSLSCQGDNANVCGGCEPLDARPGELCGDPESGSCQAYRCDFSSGEIVCDFGTGNTCGGCGELEAAPNTECDICNSLWTCTEDNNAVFCDNEAINACRGCSVLPGEPGEPCGDGDCALWRCDEAGGMFCDEASELNDCGGCFDLGFEAPGERCGECEEEVFVCDDEIPGATVCEELPRNACDGCAELDAEPGESCPCGGDWECAPDGESLECPGQNVCGGCDFLDPGQLGTSCTPRDGGCGEVVCADENSYECAPRAENACGGCFPIADVVAPGTPCDCGEYVCDGPNLTVCEGRNVCGGCEPLDDEELLGQPCGDAGECGFYECTEGGIECVLGDANVCGGCLELGDAQLGQPCGCGGETECVGPDEIACSSGNPCGGCDPIANESQLGNSCTPPQGGCGRFLCTDATTIGCEQVPRNECGGCEVLDAIPGTACGPDGCGALVCSANLNSLTCDESECP